MFVEPNRYVYVDTLRVAREILLRILLRKNQSLFKHALPVLLFGHLALHCVVLLADILHHKLVFRQLWQRIWDVVLSRTTYQVTSRL